MTFNALAVAVLLMVLLSACTGARVVNGRQPIENANVIYWWCSGGELHARRHITDSAGNAFWNPFSPDSSDFQVDDYVPPGKVVVTVEVSGGIKRQRIITHAFDQTCSLPWNGKMTEQQCSKDGFSLSALNDGFDVEENAPVYRLPTEYTWTCSTAVPPSTNLLFPPEWPASCRDSARALQLRRAMMSVAQASICNVY